MSSKIKKLLYILSKFRFGALKHFKTKSCGLFYAPVPKKQCIVSIEDLEGVSKFKSAFHAMQLDDIFIMDLSEQFTFIGELHQNLLESNYHLNLFSSVGLVEIQNSTAERKVGMVVSRVYDPSYVKRILCEFDVENLSSLSLASISHMLAEKKFSFYLIDYFNKPLAFFFSWNTGKDLFVFEFQLCQKQSTNLYSKALQTITSYFDSLGFCHLAIKLNSLSKKTERELFGASVINIYKYEVSC